MITKKQDVFGACMLPDHHMRDMWLHVISIHTDYPHRYDMNFPLHFLDEELAVNIGVHQDAISSHRNQPKVCGNNDSIYSLRPFLHWLDHTFLRLTVQILVLWCCGSWEGWQQGCMESSELNPTPQHVITFRMCTRGGGRSRDLEPLCMNSTGIYAEPMKLQNT